MDESAHLAASALANQSSVAGFYRGTWMMNRNAWMDNSLDIYAPVFGGNVSDCATGNEGCCTQVAAVATTVKNLRCALTDAAGAPQALGNGVTATVTFRDALADTALTLTFSATDTAKTDLVHMVSAAAGDLIDYHVTDSGSPANNPYLRCSVEADL
jgi:hypothetical protein